VPNRLELRSKELWDELKVAQSHEEVDSASARLLSHLGGIRAVVGKSSVRGQKIANEMHSIRQKRGKANRQWQAEILAQAKTRKISSIADSQDGTGDLPF
jgi:hypothetical protein